MSSGINLLSKKEDVSLKEKKRVKILRIIAGAMLGVTALVIVTLIVLYSQLKIASIKRDQESAIKNISFLHEKSAKLSAINDRVDVVTQVLKKRKDFQNTLTELTKQIPSGVKINGIDVSSDGVSMRLSATSLYDAKIFIDRMVALAEGKKIIKDLTIESFLLDTKNSRYSLVLSSNLL
jgi:Tfp pilus assembly protein PilN